MNVIIKQQLRLSILIIAFIQIVSVVSYEKVNCRRVVFHPYCRGISAKRRLNLQEEKPMFQENIQAERRKNIISNDNSQVLPYSQYDNTRLLKPGVDPIIETIVENGRHQRAYPPYLLDISRLMMAQQRRTSRQNMQLPKYHFKFVYYQPPFLLRHE